MGKKYIIEIPDDKIADFIGSTHFLMPYMMAGHIGHYDTGLPIEPYTEPDTNEAYQRGAEDMQKALRLLIDCDEGCLTILDMFKAFGESSYLAVVREHPAMEIIEKIQAYEQEQEEQIQVGDEVKNTQTGVKFIVTHLWENNRGEQGVSGFNQECSAFSTTLSLVVKTGRHFSEITELLRKMKES